MMNNDPTGRGDMLLDMLIDTLSSLKMAEEAQSHTSIQKYLNGRVVSIRQELEILRIQIDNEKISI